MKGVVTKLDPLKNFGFVRALNRNEIPIGDEHFFHCNENVKVDCIGRVHLKVDDPVEFEPSIKNGKLRATNIINLSATNIDPHTHKEWSVISRWYPADIFSEVAQAWLTRDTGDQLVLFSSDICNFRAIERHLHADLWVYHSVAQSAGRGHSGGKFHAKCAQVYIPGINESEFVFDDLEAEREQYPSGSVEAHFLSLPDLETAIGEADDQDKPGQVYAATERKLPLREIIRRQRTHSPA
jgi:hypothetical protein